MESVWVHIVWALHWFGDGSTRALHWLSDGSTRALHWLSDGSRPVDWLSWSAELLVAFVIYWEVEQGRAADVLAGLGDESFYSGRAELYESYTATPGATLKERAQKFSEVIEGDPALRRKVDAQWEKFNRLQYSLRFSIFHRQLLATWFPHVVVSMWVMLAIYLDRRRKMRPTPLGKALFERAVRRSLRELQKLRIQEVTIFGKDTKGNVVVTQAELRAMREDLFAPFHS